MSLKQLRSRVTRLEQAGKGSHCEGCNELTARRIQVESQEGFENRQERNWEALGLGRCSVCGNPDPQMSIEYARRLAKMAEETK